jgi:hypothetical protein
MLLGLAAVLFVLAWPGAATAFEEASVVPRGWQLDFTHDRPRTLAVTLADGSVRWFWYMAYKVVNNTGDDRLFIPEFTIATDAGDILTAGQNVPASVWPAVARKLNNALLESPSQIVGKILQGEDYARESVAVWPVPAHDVDEMSLFVGGISGETATGGAKGVGYHYSCSGGRPRLRVVLWRAKRSIMRLAQRSSPYGRHLVADRRSAASSGSLSGVFTVRSHCRGRPDPSAAAVPIAAVGHADNSSGGPSSPTTSARPGLRQRHRLDQRQSSARSTSDARAALRSTYRQTVNKCSPASITNDLKRPW